MPGPHPQVEHPYIVRKDGVASGVAVVIGTKFPVRSVVQYVLRQGMTPEELVREFPQLSLPNVYDAISYYYDHREEVDKELAENTEAHWRKRS